MNKKLNEVEYITLSLKQNKTKEEKIQVLEYEIEGLKDTMVFLGKLEDLSLNSQKIATETITNCAKFIQDKLKLIREM